MIIAITIIFVLYVGYVWIKFGIQDSISKSYYKTKLFIPFCLSMGGGAFYLGYNFNLWLQLSGISLIIVGALPDIKYTFIKERHLVAAISSVVFAQVYVITVQPALFALFVCCSGVAIFLRNKISEIWWVEIFAFITLILSLYE